jgi:hypothetical protein
MSTLAETAQALAAERPLAPWVVDAVVQKLIDQGAEHRLLLPVVAHVGAV